MIVVRRYPQWFNRRGLLRWEPNFPSMKITQDVRDRSAAPNEKEQAMADMSKRFLDMGAQVYVDKEQAVRKGDKVPLTGDRSAVAR
jgi:hypothetical protein